MSFVGRGWRKSSGFELKGHVNGGREEWKKASSREREERECLSCGGVSRGEEGGRST